MTLNGVIALILPYFREFDSFAGLLRHSNCIIVCRISSSTFCQNSPTLQRGLSAIAELLVIYPRTKLYFNVIETPVVIARCYNVKITQEVNVVIKTLRLEQSWSSQRPMKEFPQKEWSRISLDPFIQKN